MSGASGGVLSAVVAELREGHRRLTMQREAIDAQLAAIDAARAAFETGGGALTGTAASPSAAAYNPGSLKQHIEQVLSRAGRPLRLMEITEAVRRSGFKTRNKTLDKSIGISLGEMRTVKRIGRGVYRVR